MRIERPPVGEIVTQRQSRQVAQSDERLPEHRVQLSNMLSEQYASTKMFSANLHRKYSNMLLLYLGQFSAI